MTILQLVDVPWDSGLAHYALMLARGLVDAGHRVIVSTVEGQKPWAKAKRLGLETVPWASLRHLRRLRSLIAAEKIEILNAHTGRTHSLAVAASLGQRVAVIRTRSDARAVRRSLGSRFLFRRTARVIAAADYIRRDFQQTLNLRDDHVVTIHQGIDVADYPPAPLPAPLVLGIVARLDPVKGHRHVLEALAQVRPLDSGVRLRIIGQEENVKERDLRHLAERLHVLPFVDFRGFRRDIPAEMRECSVGVIASTGSEAVSRAALEWMAAGRPVLATRVGCLPELVEPFETGLLMDPADSSQLAVAISKLLMDPALMQRMGGRGRLRAETMFSQQRFVEKTLAVYDQAVRELP